jgi:hypothetical protein
MNIQREEMDTASAFPHNFRKLKISPQEGRGKGYRAPLITHCCQSDREKYICQIPASGSSCCPFIEKIGSGRAGHCIEEDIIQCFERQPASRRGDRVQFSPYDRSLLPEGVVWVSVLVLEEKKLLLKRGLRLWEEVIDHA